VAQIEKSVEVDVPVSVTYNQWTQFEDFPRFMEGVKEVKQLDDKRLRWRAEVAGKDVEWLAEITSQEPDRRIGWKSIGGAMNSGVVLFEPLGPSKTRVTLNLQYEPEGAVENTGSALGVVSARVGGDLKRFKEFIEERGRATGGWRGEIHGSEVRKSDTGAREAGAS
jgi:uncharacterized membrane protein